MAAYHEITNPPANPLCHSNRQSLSVGLFSGNTMKKIPLTQGKVAIVDDEDYEELSQFKWFAQKEPCTYYAARRIYLGNGAKNPKQKTIRMHRLLMNAKKKQEVDHINGNGLDNRKSDLRLCTHSENARNRRLRLGGSSLYKGVYWHKSRKKWQSQIVFNYQIKYLGRYDNEIEAAKAYDYAAKELFGEFALTNF